MNIQKHLAAFVLLLLLGSISGPVTPWPRSGLVGALGDDHSRANRRDPGQPRHGLGNVPPLQQARPEPAGLDSVDGLLPAPGVGASSSLGLAKWLTVLWTAS